MLIGDDHQMAGAIGKQVQNHEVEFPAVHDQVFRIVMFGGNTAEDASGDRESLLNVLIAPRTPEVVHNGGRASSGAFRLPAVVAGAGFAAGSVHQVLQFLAGLEIGNALGWHFHARAGLRIASHARLALPGAETAESADLDLVSPAQRRTMLSKMASTITSESLRVISTTRETSSINSAFVICALSPYVRSVLTAFSLYSDIHYFFDGHGGCGGVALVILQPGSFLVVGQARERSGRSSFRLRSVLQP